MRNSKCFLRLISFLVIINPFTNLSAQPSKAKQASSVNFITPNDTKAEIRKLNIGDKAPDIEFTMVNYPSRKRLSDFRGKLITMLSLEPPGVLPILSIPENRNIVPEIAMNPLSRDFTGLD